MSVSRILEEKSGEIVTVPPESSVANATKLLAECRIGAVIVCEKKRGMEGILSERDIVRAIAREGVCVLEYPVSRCMTKKVFSCTLEDSINHIMEVMTNNRFRHMPVTSEGKLVGIISIGDVVKCRIEQAEKEAEDMRIYISS